MCVHWNMGKDNLHQLETVNIYVKMNSKIYLQSLHTSLSYKMLKMKRGKCKKIKKILRIR